MTRGNQREMDRAKAMKKQSAQKKDKDQSSGVSLQNVKLQNAEIMRRKQMEAEARKSALPEQQSGKGSK